MKIALEAIQPNPVHGRAINVRFTLPSVDRGRIELYDVSGRVVAREEIGQLGPGRHALQLRGERGIRPGVYLVRLQHGAEVRVKRAVVVE